jgi:hypothetical protein
VTTLTLRTAEQTQISLFWGYDGSPGLATPPRLYNQIAEVPALQQNNSEVQNARFFALVNIAMADAGIACWDGKYDYNFWRPITAIRENDPGTGPTGLGSGNLFLVGQGDPGWTPLGAPADNGHGTNFTPPFPAYASGHATFGAALFRTMADFFGRDYIQFTIGSDEFNGVTQDQNGEVRPVVYRTFTSFSQAAEENGQSRIYLGIHWSFDKEQGIICGDRVADYVFAHLLKPRHNRSSLDALPSDSVLASQDLVSVGLLGATPAGLNGAQAEHPSLQNNGLATGRTAKMDTMVRTTPAHEAVRMTWVTTQALLPISMKRCDLNRTFLTHISIGERFVQPWATWWVPMPIANMP